MVKEKMVKDLIKGSYHTVKEFSKAIGLPYTTLLGMLKNGLGGASVDNVIKVCRGLGITVEQLLVSDTTAAPITPFYVSDNEKQLIMGYRNKPEMRPAVDALLGTAKDT